MMKHFNIETNVQSPSPSEIELFLEKTWDKFQDLFGVQPPTVKVVFQSGGGSASAGSRVDQGERVVPEGAQPIMAWGVFEGEVLTSQGFNDLSHEIAHIYFLQLMGNPQGLHQPHAWLHEAVACFHEGKTFIENRNHWMREHLGEYIPLRELFTMKNPVKTNPMVELTVRLHEKLAKGEINVIDLNRQISEYATQHSQELAQPGKTNMTFYSESLSVFSFLLEKEGRDFVRSMVQDLRTGKEMGDVIQRADHFKGGVETLEKEWVRWVKEINAS
jgi:hypothetical protein